MKGTKRFIVRGMHCAACIALVRREFESLPGTRAANVNLAKGSAVVDWEGETEPDDASYINRIEPFGYEAVRVESADEEPQAESVNAKDLKGAIASWSLSALAAGGILGLYWLVQEIGLADRAAARTEASVVTALLAGAAASVSSCLALVGSLVLALGSFGTAGSMGAADSMLRDRRTTPLTRNLLFQGGRVAGFALLGGLLGLAGGSMALSGRAVSVLTVAVGILTLVLGLSLIGAIPGGIAARLPRRFSKTLDFLASSPNPASPLTLGAATFFLPCGFTLSMQALALASGSFGSGAAIMGAFALGTAPVLLGVGLAGAWTKRRGVVLARAAGLVVIAFASQSILSGASLFGFTGNVLDTAAAAAAAEVKAVGQGALSASEVLGAEADVQRVTMTVLASAFEPSVIHVKAGIPVEWTIIGGNPSGCTNRIVIPSADASFPIRKGVSQVVRFTADEPGTIPFSCWMGMVHGKIVVN